MKRWKVASKFIQSTGYDALCAVLEVEYLEGGEIWQYLDVPESVWYALKSAPCPEIFLHKNVIGKYEEQNLSKK